MAKSLEEIEKTFHEQCQQQSLPKKDEQRNLQEKDEKRTKRNSLAPDIIFCVAIVGLGVSAVVLSWERQSGTLGRIYDVFWEHYGVIVLTFLTLIVISFALRFSGNMKSKAVKKEDN